MSALSPATRAVLDSVCDDGLAPTQAVMRHMALEVRATLAALQSRLAAAEAERDDLRRYRKSWDKELRDAREAAKTAIDGRIAAEAERDAANHLLRDARACIDFAGKTHELAGWTGLSYRICCAANRMIDAHLASRPEGEVRHG